MSARGVMLHGMGLESLLVLVVIVVLIVVLIRQIR